MVPGVRKSTYENRVRGTIQAMTDGVWPCGSGERDELGPQEVKNPACGQLGGLLSKHLLILPSAQSSECTRPATSFCVTGPSGHLVCMNALCPEYF